MKLRNRTTKSILSLLSTGVGTVWVFLVLGCSSDPAPGTAGGGLMGPSEGLKGTPVNFDSDEAPAPHILSLRIEPKRPTPDQEVRAVVSLSNAKDVAVDLDYAWSLAGQEIRSRAAALRFPASRKGEIIEVTVTVKDEKGRSSRATASERVGNRPPVLIDVELVAGEKGHEGHSIEARVQTRDPDGDSQRVLYDWRVNGRQVSERSSSLETRDLKRGDEVQLWVSADDGDDHSEVVKSDPLVIPNSPPEIVSDPVNDSESGSFSYQVEARDPDRDLGLIYSLIQGPAGMTISRLGGRLTWSPGTDQNGVHTIIVRVEDRYGDASEQRFDVTISNEASAPELASARY